jgi:hypothetical protein
MLAHCCVETISGNELRFVNHSCAPNCTLDEVNWNGTPALALISLRTIFPQEELTFHYHMDYRIGDAIQRCSCGALKCQKFLNPPAATSHKDTKAEYTQRLENSMMTCLAI